MFMKRWLKSVRVWIFWVLILLLHLRWSGGFGGVKNRVEDAGGGVAGEFMLAGVKWDEARVEDM
ncbi:hypothetical protein HanIR_Chr01g0000291 [Helianthus annuus]|nr:hypothetical protein HanIR_Chr01g0000291 [Helianthus annuus]